MAWGISPRKIATIPLCDYNPDFYLTLLYNAFNNLGWHTGYFNRDGIIAYTDFSLESYAEEVSVRIVGNNVVIKSECVGYQFFFTDYGKNQKNIDLLLGEITYVEYHIQHHLDETTQELIDSIPDNQFISLDNPPMGHKEKLRDFLSAFTPAKNYWVTPVMVLLNIALYIITTIVILLASLILRAPKLSVNRTQHITHSIQSIDDVYLALGFNGHSQVLNGEVWRLITSVFMHFSLMHVLGNMVVLIYIGSLLEGKLGRWNYFILYICTGICASITSIIWRDQGISAGASGAIFGLFGILLGLLSTNFYESNARRALLISTAVFVIINILPLGNRVDHAAHFGGLISGYILGLLAYYGLRQQKRSFVTISAVAITVLFTGLCLQFTPAYNYKGYDKLSEQIKPVFNDLIHDIYANTDTSQQNRIAYLKSNALPKIEQMRAIGRQFENLHLPPAYKKAAQLKSKIITQECVIYTLVYKEVVDTTANKYRPGINAATDSVNRLRKELGTAEREAGIIDND